MTAMTRTGIRRSRGRKRGTGALAAAVGAMVLATLPVTAAAAPALDWSRVVGRRGASEMVLAVAAGADDTLAVVGRTTGALPGLVSKGGTDAFLRTYDLDGSVRWTRQFGSPDVDRATGVAIGRSGEIYVVGATGGTLPGQRSRGATDAFIQRWTPGGRLAWTRQLGSVERDWATAVTVDPSGVPVLVGITEGSLGSLVNSGGRDGFIRRYAPDGSVLWTRMVGTRLDDELTGVTTDASGGPVAAGRTYGALGGLRPLGGSDVVVRAYTPSGAIRWTRRVGSADNDLATGIAPGPDGGTYVVGFTGGEVRGQTAAGGDDALLVLLRANGSVAWVRQFGTPAHDQANAVTVDASGAARVAGETDGDLVLHGAIGMTDGFVRAVSPDGTDRWTIQLGTARVDLALGIAVDARDGTCVGGSQGSFAPGSGDGFLRRYRPEA